MRTTRRRAFRSPLIMEISFRSHDSNNTPSLHTLAKNYLDLLKQPTTRSLSRRRNILFKDDGLIDVLVVNHSFGPQWGNAGISITTAKMSHFHQDLRLVREVEWSDFEDYNRLIHLPKMRFLKSCTIELARNTNPVSLRGWTKHGRVQKSIGDSADVLSGSAVIQLDGDPFDKPAENFSGGCSDELS